MPSVDDRDRRSGTGPNNKDDVSEPERAAPADGTQVVKVDVVLPRAGRSGAGDPAAPLPQGKRPSATADVLRRPTSGEGAQRRTATGDMRAVAAPASARKPEGARGRQSDAEDNEFTTPQKRLPPLATDPASAPVHDEPDEGSTSLNAIPGGLLPPLKSSLRSRDDEPEENHTSVNQIPSDELPALPSQKAAPDLDDGLETGLNVLPAGLSLPPLPEAKPKPARKPTPEVAVPWGDEPPAPVSKRGVVAPVAAPPEPVSKRGVVVPPAAAGAARKPTRSEVPAVPAAPEVPVAPRKPTRGEVPVVPQPGPQARKATRGEVPVQAQARPPEPKDSHAEPEERDLESTDTAPLPVLKAAAKPAPAAPAAAAKGLRNAKLLDIETGEVDVRGFPGGIKPVEEVRSANNQNQSPAKRTRIEDLLTGVAPVGDLEADRPTSVPEQKPKAPKAPKAHTGALKKVASMTGMHVFGGEDEVRSLTGLARLSPARRNGFQVVFLGLFLFVGAGVAAHFYFSGPEKPALEELQMIYPYHFQGGVLPNGRTAPGAESVKFDYKGIVTCGASQCLQYEAQGEDGVFALPMIVRHEGTSWVLVENRGH